MPAKRPSGARNETVKCEFCGEDYAVTYKRCPFCEEDEPTRIFRKPQVEAPTRPVRRQDDEPDEYEELLSRRPRKVEEDEEDYEPPRRRSRRDEGMEDEPPRRRARYEDEEDDEYEPARRRSRRDDYDDDEDDDDYEPRRRRGHDGGKRLVTNERGGGYRRRGPSAPQIIGAILSVALVAAAVYIVFLIVKPLFGEDNPTPPPSDPVVTGSPSPSVPPTVEPSDVVIPTGEPGVVVPPAESQTPPPVVTTIPGNQTATGFGLYNQWGTAVQDITLEADAPSTTLKVVFTPAGSTGSITWHSSKSNIATVDENGKVTAVAQGVATITATMAGGYTRECMVRSNVGGTPSSVQPSAAPSVSAPAIPSAAPSAAPSTPPSTAPSASATLAFNVSGADFTLSGAGDAWTLKVKNAVGTPTWAVKDSSIATVDANGRVTAVAKGVTTVTATVDGQTLECIVRVS